MKAQPQRERRREFLIEQGRFADLVREGFVEVISGVSGSHGELNSPTVEPCELQKRQAQVKNSVRPSAVTGVAIGSNGRTGDDPARQF